MKHQPYIYFLQHKPSGKYYCGANGSREAHPDNLLKTYFTGSRTIKYLLERDGVEAFDILHIIPCDTIEECHYWEYLFLKNIDPFRNPEWLNIKPTAPNCYPKPGPSHPKYGVPMPEKNKEILRAMTKGKSKPPEQALKMSEASRGKSKSEAHRQAMSIAQKGKSKIYLTGWTIIRPNGVAEIVLSLSQYCRLHGLSQGCMSSVASGKSLSHKGHRCRRGILIPKPKLEIA